MTCIINAAAIADKKELHSQLRLLLSLPEHYGENADALYDCLSERRDPVDVLILGAKECPAAAELRKVMCVIRDLGGEVISEA